MPAGPDMKLAEVARTPAPHPTTPLVAKQATKPVPPPVDAGTSVAKAEPTPAPAHANGRAAEEEAEPIPQPPTADQDLAKKKLNRADPPRNPRVVAVVPEKTSNPRFAASVLRNPP